MLLLLYVPFGWEARSNLIVSFLQGKTPADQADGDAELAAYLSSSSASHEDLETAVWSRTRSRTLCRSGLCALDVERKTFGFDSSGGEVGDEPEEMNCFSSQQHCRGDFTGLLFICIYLFIFYLLVVPIEWMTDRRTIRMQVQLDQPSHVVSSPVSHLIRDSCIFYSLRLLQWFKVYKVSFQRS